MVAQSHPLRHTSTADGPSGGPQHIGEILPALLASYSRGVAERRPAGPGNDSRAGSLVSRLPQALVA